MGKTRKGRNRGCRGPSGAPSAAEAADPIGRQPSGKPAANLEEEEEAVSPEDDLLQSIQDQLQQGEIPVKS